VEFLKGNIKHCSSLFTVICAISLPLQKGCLFTNAHYLWSNQGHKNLLLYLFIRMEDVDSNGILFADRMITLPFSQIEEVHTTTPVSKDQVRSSVGKIFGQSVKIPVFPSPTLTSIGLS
jgi:hypothetical protein